MSNYKPTGIPGLYVSGTRLGYRLKSPVTGKWEFIRSDYAVGQEAAAERALSKLRRALEAGVEIFGAKAAPATVGEYAELKFFPRRREAIEDWKSDETRIREHVFTFKTDAGPFARLPLKSVRTRHLIDAFGAFRKKRKPNGEPYAPKSIWNTYGVVKALFRDAIIDEILFESPCVLDERHLGENTDADPEWRETALYSREELELLISSPLIPVDRQVWYALEGIAAMRLGEAAALRWRHWDTSLEPLGSLLIARSHAKEHTKTKRVRKMPVHPVLASILADWKLNGWPQLMDRHPQPDDLVVPTSKPGPGKGYRLPAGAMRTEKYVSSRIKDDLKRLGLRHRRGHDLRATLITWALVDGANNVHLESCTHTPKKGKAFDLYNRIPWAAKCEAVAAFQIRRQAHARGELIDLREAVGAGEQQSPFHTSNPSEERLVTRLLPPRLNMRNVEINGVEAAGIEPVARQYTDTSEGQSKTSLANEIADVGALPTNTSASDVGAREAMGNKVTNLLRDALAEWQSFRDEEVLRTQLAKLQTLLGGGQ